MNLPAKSKHNANGSLSYLKSIVCVFMSVVWFKIISRTDICMKVIQATQATLDTEVANIQELLKDLAELRNIWQAVWNEVTTVASNLGIEIKFPPGGTLDLRRSVSVGKGKKSFQEAYYRTFIFYASVVQLLLTYGPFYKNVGTHGPLPTK